LYDEQNDASALTAVILRAITLDGTERARMLTAAHARVQRERDMVANLAQTLRFFWPQPVGCGGQGSGNGPGSRAPD
jgi:hypothetical protein